MDRNGTANGTASQAGIDTLRGLPTSRPTVPHSSHAPPLHVHCTPLLRLPIIMQCGGQAAVHEYLVAVLRARLVSVRKTSLYCAHHSCQTNESARIPPPPSPSSLAVRSHGACWWCLRRGDGTSSRDLMGFAIRGKAELVAGCPALPCRPSASRTCCLLLPSIPPPPPPTLLPRSLPACLPGVFCAHTCSHLGRVLACRQHHAQQRVHHGLLHLRRVLQQHRGGGHGGCWRQARVHLAHQVQQLEV